jgi:DNA polymerase I-like protein with 3'-5' exonuclease and polymerase domains
LASQFPHLAAGVIHSRFESLRETGRSACGGDGDGGSSYNLQNPPTGDPAGKLLGERECFVPRPGFVFGDNDYSGLELCTGSQMCIDQYGRSEMAEVLNLPAPENDVHLDFAGTILGRTDYPWLLKNKKTPEVGTARDTAKRCNFGLGGGMGPRRFVATCNRQDAKLFIATGARPAHTITLPEATGLVVKWKDRWSAFKLHFAWAKGLTGSYDDPKPATVKQLRVDRWRGGLDYPTVCNTPFQGLGGDVAKDALFEVVWEMYDPAAASVLLGSYAVNFIHDQIISEFPISRAHACAMRQTAIMNDVARRFLPDCPARTAPTLARRWSKGASELRDAAGELVAWEHPAL